MVACAGAAYWMLTDDSFAVAAPQLTGDLKYTDPQTILAAAGIVDGQHPNVISLRTDEMARSISGIPAIAQVNVTTTLPNRVAISVTEREPIFAVHWSGGTYLVDSAGLVIAAVDEAKAAQLGIPVIEDHRTSVIPENGQAGATVDPIDLAAILQLGAVSPSMIGSSASSLALEIDDDDGFVISAQPDGWRAVFGQYTPNLRPTDLIPRQVQCLSSLIGAGEQDVRTVYLAPLDERCGTYVPVATPVVPTPAPTKSR